MTDNTGYVKEESNAPAKLNEPDKDYEVPLPYDKIAPYAGMPKEVLLNYSRSRGFRWARDILTGMVVLTILVLFCLVVSIIAISPPCLEFWQTSPIYEIYPKSFRSTNDDNGFGDINGITEKLKYLSEDLGVNVISVNSMYKSSQIANDYEVSDFKKIDPTFGTMADMEELIFEAHNEGIKVVIDFIPNHSSDQHHWFLASSNVSHADHEKYKDYYVWVDGNNASDLPNNWANKNGSSWTWNENRQKFYYHAFSTSQPDLNLHNKNVRDEMLDTLRFWLEKGVDGFRAIGTSYMLEATHLRDNPLINPSLPPTGDNMYHDYTMHYEGNHDIVVEWKSILDEYSTEPGVFRFLETYDEGDLASTIRYYGTEIVKESSFPFNSLLAKSEDWNAAHLATSILDWIKNMPEGSWPNWAIGGQDYSRIENRSGPEIALNAALMTMTLPGTPTIYYGDEIGMSDTNGAIPTSARSVMMWDDSDNYGFCKNCTPWNDNDESDVDFQTQKANGSSTFGRYKSMISLRKEMVFQRGYLCMLGDLNGTLGYIRELSGVHSMLILLNFHEVSSSFKLQMNYPGLPSSGSIELMVGSGKSIAEGDSISLVSTSVPPKTGLVISFNAGEDLMSKSSSMSDKCFIHTKVCYSPGLQVVQYC